MDDKKLGLIMATEVFPVWRYFSKANPKIMESFSYVEDVYLEIMSCLRC